MDFIHPHDNGERSVKNLKQFVVVAVDDVVVGNACPLVFLLSMVVTGFVFPHGKVRLMSTKKVRLLPGLDVRTEKGLTVRPSLSLVFEQ